MVVSVAGVAEMEMCGRLPVPDHTRNGRHPHNPQGSPIPIPTRTKSHTPLTRMVVSVAGVAEKEMCVSMFGRLPVPDHSRKGRHPHTPKGSPLPIPTRTKSHTPLASVVVSVAGVAEMEMCVSMF